MIESSVTSKCVAIDLEVGRESVRIHHLAAIRGDRSDKPFLYSGANLDVALPQLDAFAMS